MNQQNSQAVATQEPSVFDAVTPHVPISNSLAQHPALGLWFNDQLFERAKLMATYMSRAEGFTPRHLVGKTEACFLVVEKSLVWGLSPSAVAASTYQTPGGTVGFEGKLVQAILQASGRLARPIQYKHFGDWSKVRGKFEVRKNNNGKDYAVASYTAQDEQGLGVKVVAHLKGQEEPEEFEFLLRQAFPRNSTLWATDPMTQICYAAVRRFASVRLPDLVMGVPFDGEGDWGPVVDITPTNTVSGADIFAQADAAEQAQTSTSAPIEEDDSDAPEEQPTEFEVLSADGEVIAIKTKAIDFVTEISARIARFTNSNELTAFIEANQPLVSRIEAAGWVADAGAVLDDAAKKIARLDKEASEAQQGRTVSDGEADTADQPTGTDGGEQPAAEPEPQQEAEGRPASWLVDYPRNAKSSGPLQTYLSRLREMMNRCNTVSDWQAFSDENLRNLKDARQKHPNLSSRFDPIISEIEANAG